MNFVPSVSVQIKCWNHW